MAGGGECSALSGKSCWDAYKSPIKHSAEGERGAHRELNEQQIMPWGL